MSYINVESFNLVRENNAVTPNYDLNGREIRIALYFTLTGEVIIVGEFDNNYIYWLSVTKTCDTEINGRIFDRVACGVYKYVSNTYLALKEKGLDYGVTRRSYAAVIKRRADGKGGWQTPFGHYYGDGDTSEHGGYFANDVSVFLSNLIKKCNIREAGGLYKAVLEKYADYIASVDFMDYGSKVEPVLELLAKEEYLIVSPNKDIREAYIRCRDLCYEKYNAYMTAVR